MRRDMPTVVTLLVVILLHAGTASAAPLGMYLSAYNDYGDLVYTALPGGVATVQWNPGEDENTYLDTPLGQLHIGDSTIVITSGLFAGAGPQFDRVSFDPGDIDMRFLVDLGGDSFEARFVGTVGFMQIASGPDAGRVEDLVIDGFWDRSTQKQFGLSTRHYASHDGFAEMFFDFHEQDYQQPTREGRVFGAMDLEPVPEPASLTLFGLGVGALYARRRRS